MRNFVGQERKDIFQMPKRKLYERVKIYFYGSKRQKLENGNIFDRYISVQNKYIRDCLLKSEWDSNGYMRICVCDVLL